MLWICLTAWAGLFIWYFRMRKKAEDHKLVRRIFCLAATGFIAGTALCLPIGVRKVSGDEKAELQLERGALGSQPTEEKLEVSVGNQKPERITLSVPARAYSAEEIEEAFSAAIEALDEIILGENLSFHTVNRNMDLVTEIPGSPVALSWETDRPLLIDSRGLLSDEIPEEGVEVTLKAELELQGETTEYIRKVQVYPPEIKGRDAVLRALKKAVEKEVKSERTKTELITNVSHDLKTPLTSIISYIDLLKKMDLDDEASSYVKILDKKAQKLKGIVSDVFSIAKATSGVDVNLTKLDFVMLLNQCIADAEDKIADSGKIVKININADSAMVMGDGDKLYRVFQNIVDNALNYSMDGTRIFLDVYKKADRIVFAEKNISATPINFTEEEILERFVRGDKSRTDGGSGLGLSISKSFTEACGGIFNIEIDGDMFKAIVEMPIIQEDTAEKTDDKTE